MGNHSKPFLQILDKNGSGSDGINYDRKTFYSCGPRFQMSPIDGGLALQSETHKNNWLNTKNLETILSYFTGLVKKDLRAVDTSDCAVRNPAIVI
jgi:hypothetical protein